MKEQRSSLYHLVRNCSHKLRSLNKSLFSATETESEKNKWKEVARGASVLWSWIILTTVAFENPAYAAPVAVALIALLAYYVRH